MSEPLVSVLIPAFNSAAWIEETLRSVLDQTWPRMELIVVDDGSADDTALRARRFESNRVRIVTQTNRGAAAARNLALSLAQGDFVQWLDADDLLAPRKVEHQVRAALQDRSRRTLYSSSFGEFACDIRRAQLRPTTLWRDLTPLEYFLEKFNAGAWFNPACWLLPRAVAETAGPWDERLSLDDDGEYFCRVVANADAIRFVPDARVYYRRANPSSLSRVVSERACESLMLSLQLCIDQLRKLEDSDRTRAASVRYLQSWVDASDCLCPDAPARFAKAQALAGELGGLLKPQRLSWKYVPIGAAFGHTTARRFRALWGTLKLRAQFVLERLGAAHRG